MQLKTWHLLLPLIPVSINLAFIGITHLNIYNNYDAPIQYAVDSSPIEAVQQFNTVKDWMEVNKLTNGNTCIFITTNPSCKLSNYYNNRVLLSIEESKNVNIKDTTAVSNLSLKLNERFIGKGDKGKEYIKHPINLNLYMRWGNLKSLGYWLDIVSFIYLGLALFLIKAFIN